MPMPTRDRRRAPLRRIAALAAGLTLLAALFAGPAVAHRASAKQRIRAQLLKQVKKNPRIVLRKSFLRKAGLVHFILPVTVRLRGSNNSTSASPVYDDANPNLAFADLGASLGNRTVNLGGSLPAEVEFNDQYDGGALGNVRINLLPGGQGLNSTSIPLLWNRNVSTLSGGNQTLGALGGSQLGNHQWWGPAYDGYGYTNPQTGANSIGEYNDGCGSFTGNSNLPTPLSAADSAYSLGLPGGGLGIPYFTATANPPSEADPTGSAGNALAFAAAEAAAANLPAGPAQAAAYATAASLVAGFIPVIPGVDSLTALRVSGETTPYLASTHAAIDNIGTNSDPFPTSDDPNFDPLNSGTAPNVQDTVARTAPLTIKVAPAGTEVNQTDAGIEGTRGVDGSQNIVLGKSGGQANLFGNIPGKNQAIDVTVSLEAKINTIFRGVDMDWYPPIAGEEFPPGSWQCRQAMTGWVQNYFPGVRLKGSLQISPAITKDGKLRIAKAQLSSEEPTHFAVAACLYPHAFYAAQANGSDTTATPVPVMPINEFARHAVPSVPCKSTPTDEIRTAGLGAANLSTLTSGDYSGYTTSADGSRVSVTALLGVSNVAADVLIGRNEG